MKQHNKIKKLKVRQAEYDNTMGKPNAKKVIIAQGVLRNDI